MRKNLDLLSPNQKYDYPLKSLESLYNKMKMMLSYDFIL